MTPQEKEASRLLNGLIDRVAPGDPELERFRDMPIIIEKPVTQSKAGAWYRPNKGQAIFGWIVGVVSLLVGLVKADTYDGAPLAPFVIGIVAIAWALGYRRVGTEG